MPTAYRFFGGVPALGTSGLATSVAAASVLGALVLGATLTIAPGALGQPTPGQPTSGQPESGQPSPAPEESPPKTDDAGKDEKGAKKKASPATAAVEPRPNGTEMVVPSSEIYAEDWWTLSRPVFELHGYYRVRAELFHNFHLGRVDSIKPLWPRPADNSFIDLDGNPREVKLCGDSPDELVNCDNNTNAGANMRFRLQPDLHISDNLRIRAQIDLLDNIVLGSTPQGYGNQPGDSGGYSVLARGGYYPLGAFAATQWAPVSGFNSTQDSITVKRAWGEYSSPIGQLRFGRMPSHWGLGVLANAGDGYDSDWQSTADRIMFITGYPPWDLYFAFAWDFASEGAINAALNEVEGQPYDMAENDDVDQYVFVAVRRQNEQTARLRLARGKPVINGGAYVVYRTQTLANDVTTSTTGQTLGQDPRNVAQGYVRRGAEAVIPDLWLQLRYKKFRFEVEAVGIFGSIENTLRDGTSYKNEDEQGNDGWNLSQLGIATQTEFRAIEDRLKLQFDFGYATGDDDVSGLAPLGTELQPQLTIDRTFSTFRFHPDYRVDLILFRNILTRVQGAYYFKPSVGYDFFRDPDGQKIGGSAALIWSRASEFVQTPGHARDLGVELNFRLYYQARDGVLNDDPEQMGGFFTAFEYGVLFPLDGLGYLPLQNEDYVQASNGLQLDTETAQAIRWYLGILF